MFTLVMVSGCQKSEVYDNPYQGGKLPLGISLNLAMAPDPLEGPAGTVVNFLATGLMPYQKTIEFSFNGEAAEVVSVTESGISVRVPANASTGVITLTVGDQVYFGPKFKVTGKISLDPEFRVSGGANKDVMYALPISDERFIMIGAFTDYDRKGLISPVNRIVRTFKHGTADVTFRSGGSDGVQNSIVQLGDQYFTAGNFSSFFINNGKSQLLNMDNITRLSDNGDVDSVLVDTYSTTHATGPNSPATGKKKAVPAFNGGTSSSISKLFRSGDQIIALGNFEYYLSHRYEQSKKPVLIGSTTFFGDSVIIDSLKTPQLLRFNKDGSLDKTYRFNAANNTGLAGGNGYIYSGVMQPDGKLVVVGSFNKFDETAAGRIVRLTAGGSVDASFNAGSGADKAVTSITYSDQTKKYLITGSFKNFNGAAADGIAMLNEDGSLDNSFMSKGFSSGGSASYARQLSNGLILVSGSFDSYNNIVRSGFMVLTASGDLAAGYNAIGNFSGFVRDVYESKNSSGQLTVMIMGGFNQIDGSPVNNITRLVFEP